MKRKLGVVLLLELVVVLVEMLALVLDSWKLRILRRRRDLSSPLDHSRSLPPSPPSVLACSLTPAHPFSTSPYPYLDPSPSLAHASSRQLQNDPKSRRRCCIVFDVRGEEEIESPFVDDGWVKVILETDEEEANESLDVVVDSYLVVSSRTSPSSHSSTFLLDLLSSGTFETFLRSWETENDDEEGRWRWNDDDGEMEEGSEIDVEEEEIERGNETREDANGRILRIVEVVQVSVVDHLRLIFEKGRRGNKKVSSALRNLDLEGQKENARETGTHLKSTDFLSLSLSFSFDLPLEGSTSFSLGAEGGALSTTTGASLTYDEGPA